jgi:predicted MPP superfamily phosphohydrolase
MRVLAIGDIHTKTWIIDLVEKVVNEYDAIVFCGDYADNWGARPINTVNTWKRLKALCDAHPGKVLPVLGNHDYAYLHDVSCSGHNYTAEMLLHIPENRQLKDWLSALPISVELDGVTYAHAGVDERWDGKNMWSDISPLWVRPDWAQYKKVPQVVGHTPVETVTEVQPGIWLIDTFSQYHDGRPIGDGTVLAVTDGTHFDKVVTMQNESYPPGNQ